MFGGVKTMLNMVFLKNFTYLKTKFFLTIYSHVIPSLLNPITIINNIKIYNYLLLIKKKILYLINTYFIQVITIKQLRIVQVQILMCSGNLCHW